MAMDKKTLYSEEVRMLRRRISDLEKIKEEYEQALPSLKEKEKYYRLLAENTLDWVFWLDPEDRLVYMSPSCRRTTGYEVDEFFKDPKLLFKIIHTEDRATFEEHRIFMHKAKAHGEEEFRILTKDGKTRWISHACHAVYDDNGQYAGILSSNCDSTDRRLAEDKLNAISEPPKPDDSRLQALINAVTESFFLLDADGRVLYANEATAKRLGTTVEGLLACPSIFDLLPSEVAAKRRQYLEDVRTTGKGLRFEDERFGRIFLNSIYPVGTPDGRIDQFVVFGMDITSRKAAEAAVEEGRQKLDEANRMLKQVIDAIPMRIFWKDKRSVYLGGNRLFTRDAGLEKPEELIGETDANLNWRDSAERQRREDMEVISTGKPKINYEDALTTPQGKTLWIKASKVPLTDTSGRAIGVLGTYEDITTQKRAIQNLEETETRYRTLFENNHLPMLLIDPESSAIMDANPAASAFYGWRHEELLRMKISDINTLGLAEIANEMNSARLKKRNHFKFQHRLATGELRDVEVFSGPLQFNGKTLLYSTVTDITERVVEETVSRRTEKLDSLGILAGGLAHDFNNLMTIIQGYIDVASLDLTDEHPARSPLTAAQENIEKTRDITARLITFSRGGDPVLKTIRIEKLVEEAVKETLGEFPVTTSYQIPGDLWPVGADENQIHHCFCNLAENAREAMPDGGALQISAKNVNVLASDSLPLPKGPYVQIDFDDNGPGILPQDLPRIFDPYYSTKPMGVSKGMGLGLAVCYSVIKKHGGYIYATSEPGQGASLSIYLPARAAAAPKDASRENGQAGAQRRRLLVMDENEGIRMMLERYIAALGYDVTTVTDGREALEEYSRALDDAKPFRAVMMEVSVRQGWGGDVALMKLQNINPDIKAVAIVSEEDQLMSDEYRELGFQSVLAKPFRLDSVRQTLEDLFKS